MSEKRCRTSDLDAIKAMGADNISVTRRRLIGGLIVTAGVSSATGAGTMAAFTDNESSSDNTIQAGTLDLTLDDRDSTVTFLKAQNIAPGDDNIGDINDDNTITLANAGTIDGEVEVTVTAIRDDENGTGKNEEKYDDEAGGELQKYLDVRALVNGSTITGWYPVDSIHQGASLPETIVLPAGDSKQFTVEWRFNDPGNKDVNEAQTDRVEIDLNFRLVQTGGA